MGYDYYTNTYLPKKLLNEAVADITSKYESCKDSEKYELAYNILRNDYNFGYEDVFDGFIRERSYDLREKAFEYIEEQAYAGKANCQFGLGQLYYHENDYISNDESKAVYWQNEAASQGYTRAYNNVGIAYKEGVGVAVDMRKAIEWLKKGAESGKDFAQRNYGDLFRDGVKVQIGSHKKLRPRYNPAIYNKYDLYAWEDVPDYDVLTSVNIKQAKYW